MTIYDEWILESSRAPHDLDLPVRSTVVRDLLARRGIGSSEAFQRYVHPTIADLHDGALIDGMADACSRIERAIRGGEQILIYGDYDVDGVTSIVLLRTVLRALGGNVGHVVPHRLFDGYGLSTEVIDRVLDEREVRLVITVDCGITAIEPVEDALARGIDVIVTDHHLPPNTLPDAAAVLNPKKDGCRYPFKDLAGVGVAFKLCCELLRRANHGMSIESLVKVAAIGTVADVAPLVGENRTIARIGLEGLAESTNPGLRALLKSLSLYGRPLRGSDVGFRIGPRINAAGRLASADSAIDLFESRNEADAWTIVAELNRLNEQRRSVEREIIAAAASSIDEANLPRVIFAVGEGWHRGVLGLCAGRIAERFQRPTLVASIDGDECVGSGRSVGRIDLHGRLDTIRECFTRFGGHEFACGFAAETSRIPELREALGRAFSDLEPDSFVRSMRLDGELSAAEIDRGLLEEVALLEPFGAGNREPRFLMRGARVTTRREFSPGCHSVTLSDGSGTASGVIWPSASGLADILAGDDSFDIAFTVEEDRFVASGVRITLLDAAPEGRAPVRNETSGLDVLSGRPVRT